MKDIVILDGARTPMAEYNGSFSDITAIDLGVIAAKEALSRSGVAPEEINHVIVGNALQTSGDAIYGARHVGLKAGVPKEVPALTSTASAAPASSRSSAPPSDSPRRSDHHPRRRHGEHVAGAARRSAARARDSSSARGARGLLMVALLDSYCGCYMAQTTDNLARKYDIRREEQDKFAMRSQKCAAEAIKRGPIEREIVPVPVGRKGRDRSPTTITCVPRPRWKVWRSSSRRSPRTASSPPATPAASSTARRWSSSPTPNNAKKGKKPLGRIVSWGIAGCDPDIMGIGPVPATKIALKKAGMSLDDIDLIEINEAFAGQILAVVKELGIDMEKLNVNGGAIALGHPLAASGTRLVITLLYELRRRQKTLRPRLGLHRRRTGDRDDRREPRMMKQCPHSR